MRSHALKPPALHGSRCSGRPTSRFSSEDKSGSDTNESQYDRLSVTSEVHSESDGSDTNDEQ